jgi:hypothetical protein
VRLFTVPESVVLFRILMRRGGFEVYWVSAEVQIVKDYQENSSQIISQ